MQAGIAENQAITAQAELSRTELMKQAAEKQAVAMSNAIVTPETKVSPNQQSLTKADFQPPQGCCGEAQVAQIKQLFQNVGIGPKDAKMVIAKRGVNRIAELSVEQADELIEKLTARSPVPF